MTYMYYIDYQKKDNKCWYKQIYNELFLRFKIIKFDSNKSLVLINKKNINKRACSKLNRILCADGKSSCNKILVSNKVIVNGLLENEFISCKKNTMKSMILKILEYIEQCTRADYRNEDIYISICDDVDINFILDIAEKFKSINIVTSKIKKIKRLISRLEENYELNLAVSNNRRKALKKAKILINIGFSANVIEEFSLNRNCTIINLSENKLILKNSFHGSIIESIEFNYRNRYSKFINMQNFDKHHLYESFMDNYNYCEAKQHIIEDKCCIERLRGNKNMILNDELRNNFTKNSIKLDKM